MQTFYSRVLPFIIFGICLVAFLAGIILLSYLLIFGALVGLGLFCVAWLKEKLFPPKKISRVEDRRPQTIDHDELK